MFKCGAHPSDSSNSMQLFGWRIRRGGVEVREEARARDTGGGGSRSRHTHCTCLQGNHAFHSVTVPAASRLLWVPATFSHRSFEVRLQCRFSTDMPPSPAHTHTPQHTVHSIGHRVYTACQGPCIAYHFNGPSPPLNEQTRCLFLPDSTQSHCPTTPLQGV